MTRTHLKPLGDQVNNGIHASAQTRRQKRQRDEDDSLPPLDAPTQKTHAKYLKGLVNSDLLLNKRNELFVQYDTLPIEAYNKIEALTQAHVVAAVMSAPFNNKRFYLKLDVLEPDQLAQIAAGAPIPEPRIMTNDMMHEPSAPGRQKA